MEELFKIFQKCIDLKLAVRIETNKTGEYDKTVYNPDSDTYTRHWIDDPNVYKTEVVFWFEVYKQPHNPIRKLAKYLEKEYPNEIKSTYEFGQSLIIYHT